MFKILLFLLVFCQNAFADFNTGDTFGKGIVIQANGVTQTGGGRTLNFASGTTVTVNNSAYQITASGGGSGWTITDGSNIVNGVTNLTVTGGTVGGASPNATLLITGGQWNNGPNSSINYTAGNVGVGTITPLSVFHIASPTNGLIIDGTAAAQGNITQILNNTNDQTGNQAGVNYNTSQTFTTTTTGTMSAVSFYILSTNGSPTGNIRCQVQTTSGGVPQGTPTGSLANASATVDIVPVVGGLNTCSFTPFSLTAGTYAIVIHPITNQALNTWWLLAAQNPNPYAGGNDYYYDSSWHSQPTLSLYFTAKFSTNPSTLYLDQQEVTNANINSSALNTISFQDSSATTRMILNNGNLGIGVTTPGTTLDVSGSIRMTGFSLTTNPGSGKVLTSDGAGGGTWQPAGSGSGTVNSGTVNQVGYYASSTTAISGSSAMTITGNASGNNVGIGSPNPSFLLDVATVGNGAGTLALRSKSTNSITTNHNTLDTTNGGMAINISNGSGNVNVTDGSSDSILNVQNSGLVQTFLNVLDSGIASGDNVGLGTSTPPNKLYVAGTVEMQGFKMNNGQVNGYVLTTDANGVGTWQPATGGSSQWTTTNTNDVYLPANGNVGIGTNKTSTAALTVMNGNVGIGTWVPGTALDVEGTLNVATFKGGVGIGTTLASQSYAGNGGVGALNIMNGNVGIGTWKPGVLFQTGSGANTIQLSSGGNITLGQNSATVTTGNIVSVDSGGLTLHVRDASGGSTGSGITLRGSEGNSGAANSTGFILRGGDGTVASTENGGTGTVRGGDITSATGTGAPGDLTVRSGGNSNQTGPLGALIIGQTFDVQGTVPDFNKINDIGCMKASGRIGDCATSATNPIGVGIGTTAPGIVQIAGLATNVPFDGTYTPSAGWYACVSPTTAGKVIPQSTPCTTTSQVGIITQGATSVGIGTFMVYPQYGAGSQAASFVTYQPGLLTAINATIGVNYKVSKASTVDNIIGSAVTFSCVSNPTVTMYECGSSTTCSGPTTIGTVTVTAAGTLVVGTVSNATIAAGDYIGWAMTAGTCASIDIATTAQLHSN